MRFPKPPGPPDWYWRLPLAGRQRYCRWFVWKWEAVHRFCTRILTARTLFVHLPEACRYSAYCWKADRREGRTVRESISYLRYYWGICWRSWMYPLVDGPS